MESVDGAAVVEEFPDDLGLQLWKSVRAVRLWGELPPAERAGAFERDAYELRLQRLGSLDVDPQVRESMETAATVLMGEPVHVEAVVTACRHLASWAEGRNALGTALEFTQAAALLIPGDAELIHAVARVAVRRGELPRAESWYRQAIAVGRRTHDWISLAGAYLGLGTTFMRRRSYASARQTLIRGLRAAERHSLREERALLAHQLTLLALQTDRGPEAVRFGRTALEAYGSGHARLPVLALDLARHWVSAGYLPEAREVLAGIPEAGLGEEERRLRSAALARAAAAMGDSAAYEIAAAATRALDGSADATDALLDLAHAAAMAGEFPRAKELAAVLLRQAEAHGDSSLRSEAEGLLQAAAGGALIGEQVRRTPREVRRLASDLADLMATDDGGEGDEVALANAV
jgi:tetratricopeptide (TPR) repeat protein